MKTLTPKYLFAFLLLFTVELVYSQPKTGKFIKGNIGLGLVAPSEDFDIDSDGFYLQGEYVIGIKSWFGIRPYAGVIFSSGEAENRLPNERDYFIKSNAFLIGVKSRICAPIPYVAPYLEVGIGGSIGSFETYTPNTDKQRKGIISHIPFALGLAIGKHHSFEMEFTYYYHNAVDQFSGAFALGYTFSLDNE